MRTRALAIAAAGVARSAAGEPRHAATCGCGASNHVRQRALGVQPKLEVSSPGDEYEREAEAVAEHVMRMPAAGARPLRISRVAAHTQRMCAECEEEQKKGPVRRKEDGPGSPDVVARDLVPGAGAPLTPTLRGFFEPRFGRDLSGVRIHTGGQAAAVASSLQARAFTYGHDIVFGAGEYAPETFEGRRVLAHELTHVAQQAQGPVAIQQLGANAGCTAASVVRTNRYAF